jgi:hypothetical protein
MIGPVVINAFDVNAAETYWPAVPANEAATLWPVCAAVMFELLFMETVDCAGVASVKATVPLAPALG